MDKGGGERNCRLRYAAGQLGGGRALASVGVYRFVWDGAWVWRLVCSKLWKGGVLVGALLFVLVLASAWAAPPMAVDAVDGKLGLGRGHKGKERC